MLSRRRLKIGTTTSLSDTVMLRLSGIGAARASAACDALLSAGAQALLSWGVAAGLDARLPAGRLLLPHSVISANGDACDVDTEWHVRLLERLGKNFEVETGLLAEAPEILTRPADKARLRSTTGAVAADMESAAILLAGRRASKPALVMRAISDSANRTLPESAYRGIDLNGNVSIGTLLGELARRPADISQLFGVATSFFAARGSLRRAAAAVGPRFASEL